MATLTSSPVNRVADRLTQQRGALDPRATAETSLMKFEPEEVTLQSALPVFALAVIALLATAIWPILFVGVVGLLVVLGPVVALGLGVLALLRRQNHGLQ